MYTHLHPLSRTRTHTRHTHTESEPHAHSLLIVNRGAKLLTAKLNFSGAICAFILFAKITKHFPFLPIHTCVIFVTYFCWFRFFFWVFINWALYAFRISCWFCVSFKTTFHRCVEEEREWERASDGGGDRDDNVLAWTVHSILSTRWGQCKCQCRLPIADRSSSSPPLYLSLGRFALSVSWSACATDSCLPPVPSRRPLPCFALSCEPTHAMALHVKNTNKNKHCVHSGLSREMDRQKESGRVEKSEIILIEPSSGIELALLG